MTIIKNKFGAKVLDKATQSFIHFSNESVQTEFLMFFIHFGNELLEANMDRARQLLIKTYEDDTNETSSKLIEFFKNKNSDLIFKSDSYSRHFSQMAFSRAIDNFVTYFKDILSEVVLKKPQILKSNDQEKLDFILSYEKFEDLLKAISDKKIEELFYKGFTDIQKFFNCSSPLIDWNKILQIESSKFVVYGKIQEVDDRRKIVHTKRGRKGRSNPYHKKARNFLCNLLQLEREI